MPRGGGQRVVVLELSRREIPERDGADDAGRSRPRDRAIGHCLHLDRLDALRIRNRHQLGRIVASELLAEHEAPAAEHARVAGHAIDDRQTPNAAHTFVGEQGERRSLRGLERERLDSRTVSARHGDCRRRATRRSQRHQQLAGSSMLHDQRQLELTGRSFSLDGQLARECSMLERRELQRRGAERVAGRRHRTAC